MVKEPSYRVTLVRLAAVARLLHRVRLVLLLLGAVAAVWLGITLLGTAPAARSMVPLTLMLWAVLGLGVGYTLPRLPSAVRAGDGLGTRIRKRAQIVAYIMAGVLIVALAGFAVFFTLRTIGLAAA